MNKGRISRRAALVVTAITVFATPAFASLLVQNFMEADVTVADACFVKVAGADIAQYTPTDADDPSAAFDSTTNTITVDGADLLEEKLTVRGMVGDRVTYTDVVRYENNCDVPLDVTLVASTTTATGDWTDRSARIYISDVAVPTGRPGAATSGWNATPIVVDADTGNIAATNAQTGTVTVAPGGEVRGAISVSAGVTASTAGIGTVNWVAEAVNTTP